MCDLAPVVSPLSFIAVFPWGVLIVTMISSTSDVVMLHLMLSFFLAIGVRPRGWPLPIVFNWANFAGIRS